MAKNKIIKAIVFLAVGLAIFWYVYKDTSLEELKSEIKNFSLSWILLSIVLNIFSQAVRAIRWKMLFKSFKEPPKTYLLFLALMVMVFTNQIIPRGGEVARLGVVNRNTGFSFSKLLGMALAERLVDFVVLMLLFGVLVVWHFEQLMELISLPEISIQAPNMQQIALWAAILASIILAIYFLYNKQNWGKKLKTKISDLKSDLKTGFRTIRQTGNISLFLFLSVAVYAIWLIMLYVLFFSYPPTSGLSFKTATFVFGFSTLAFLLPIQAGMGAWHIIVIQTLFLNGIATEVGKVFSLIAHTATNFVFVPIGLIALLLLYLYGKNFQKIRNFKLGMWLKKK